MKNAHNLISQSFSKVYQNRSDKTIAHTIIKYVFLKLIETTFIRIYSLCFEVKSS